MKTNFKEYLKKKKTQEAIYKLAKELEGKKIILFGLDLFTGDLFRNYDLSKLNLIGVSDRFLHTHDNHHEYYGYKKIEAEKLSETEFDTLLISAYDDIEIKNYIKNELFKDKQINFNIKTIVKMNLFEYIKSLINGDI